MHPPYRPTDAERAFTACYSACHALAAAERLAAHDPDREDLASLLEVVAAQLDRLESEATERTGPVLERIARRHTRTTPPEYRR